MLNKKTKDGQQTGKKHNVLRWIIRGSLLFCFLIVLVGIFYKPIPLTSLSFEKTDIQMDVDDEASLTFSFTPDDASISSVEVMCDDGIEGSVNKNTVKIKSKKEEGTYAIYLKDHDVSSSVIHVNVVDEEKQKAEKAKKAAEEKAKKEAEEKAKKEAEEKARQEAEAQAQAQREAEAQAQRDAEAQAASQAVEQNQSDGYAPEQPIGREVYIAGSGNGKKYHSNPSCSNMKSTITLTVDEAQARGYTPCKKCF